MNFIEDLLVRLPDWFQDEEQFKLAHLTHQLYPYTALFTPIQINQLTVKNRIVMGPMGNISVADEHGRPSSKMIQYFAERARGGVGLITSGLVPFSQGIDPSVTEADGRSYFPRIEGSRTVYAGWRDLAESIHAYGARFFIQLTPGLGRVGSPEVLMHKYKLPVSASWNPNFYIPAVPCRPLTDAECRKIIQRGGQAAADAKAMQIDGVYLHGHEGYLLEQMTNRAFNRRKLGRYADWQAFGIELVETMRRRVGPHYPIMYRIDLSLALNATYQEKMQTEPTLRHFREERSVEETLAYMVNLVRAGVDCFDVDLGCYDNWWLPHPPNSMPSGCYLAVAQLVKGTFTAQHIQSNAGLPVPVVAVGKLGYPDMAEKALRDGLCDMVMLARPLLADPDWANKAFAGQVQSIRPCIGDQEACINEFIEGGHSQCAVNPRTGFEDIIARDSCPAQQIKRVAVVGAGPAGVICATTAAARGHQVTLYEKRSQIGGMLVPGSVPKIKYEVANYLTFLKNEIRDSCERHNLALKLNTEVSLAMLQDGKFDAIVICTGGTPAMPPIPGVDHPDVIQAVDLFLNPQLAESAEKVVIIGGGAVGCEAAHYLAGEYNKQVTIIEMLPVLMKGVCTANRGHLVHEMEKLGVKIWIHTRVKAIDAGRVTVERNISPTTPDPYNTWTPLLPDNIPNPLARPIREVWQTEFLDADLVVLAAGLRRNTALYENCIQANAAPEIHTIGDAFQIGRVFEAVKAGFAIGRSL